LHHEFAGRPLPTLPRVRGRDSIDTLPRLRGRDSIDTLPRLRGRDSIDTLPRLRGRVGRGFRFRLWGAGEVALESIFAKRLPARFRFRRLGAFCHGRGLRPPPYPPRQAGEGRVGASWISQYFKARLARAAHGELLSTPRYRLHHSAASAWRSSRWRTRAMLNMASA
jgi:hypothetical protein